MTHDHADNNSTTTITNQPVNTLAHAAAPPRVYDNPLITPLPTLVRESAVRDRARRRRVRTRRGGEWAWVVVAVTMLGIVIVLSMGLSLLIRSSQEGREIIPTAAAVLPTPVDARVSLGGVAAANGEQVILSDGRSVALTPWNGTSRFTVLVMGLDRRPGETGLAFRTDTIMLVSLNPAENSVGILSIPRDLYVEVPGYNQLQRINTSLVLGE